MIRGEVIISPNAQPMSTDLFCRLTFGKGLHQLAKEIAANKDGEWDDVWEAARRREGRLDK